MTGLTIRPATKADHPEISRLCWAYRDLLQARSIAFPDMVDAYYAFDSYGVLIDDLAHIHARPKGDILFAMVNKTVVGCAMYYPLEIAGVTEIKRVFVDETARGTGAGAALMRATMQAAQADGYSRVVLDTISTLTEAIALYERLGFQPCAPYYDPDPAFVPYLRFFDHPL